MLQQVNLYHLEDNTKREPFSALLMLTISIATLILMLSLYTVYYWKTDTLKTEIQSLKRQYEQNLAAVENLETMAGKLTDTKKEQAQINFLNKLYNNKQLALEELSSLVKGNNKGLSEYFSALARSNIETVWFNEINVFDGGQQLRLKGKAKAAHDIPQLIEQLREESIFSGINFKLFHAQLNEEDGLIHFSMQTAVDNSIEN